METVRIRDTGWKKVWSGIRDKHPRSATLPPAIPETMFLCTFNLFSQLSSVHVVFSLVLRICREEGCGQKNTWIDEVDEFGAGLRVHTECAVGHKMTWESSEFYNKVQFSQRVWVCKYLISGFYWWRLVTVLLVIQYIFGVHLVSSSYPSEPPILWICTLSFCSIILVFMLKKILVTVYLSFMSRFHNNGKKIFLLFFKGSYVADWRWVIHCYSSFGHSHRVYTVISVPRQHRNEPSDHIQQVYLFIYFLFGKNECLATWQLYSN